MSLYDRIEVWLTAFAVLAIAGMYAVFTAKGDYSANAVSSFIANLVTFAANESIPFVVTLITAFGVLGVIIYIILKSVK